MKLSDYIRYFLEDEEVNYVFGYIGGAITHMVDSIYKSKILKFIPVYHEQTAAIAAEGYSRNSDKIGVAMATSGPGATNLITGIADAYFDSIPVVFITGQVNTYEYKYNKKVRQQGFQETDITSIVRPITKYCELVDKPDNIRYCLEKAFYIAKTGRPCPVLLDIPMDIQRAEIDISALKGYVPEEDNGKFEDIEKENIRNMILKSKRPLILSGGGVLNSRAAHLLNDFAVKNKIPVVTSLMGKGSFDEENELFIGMIGSYGNRCANMAIANTDLLIAIGSRLDTRQTGTLLDSFVREGKIIHVDIDEAELTESRINRRVRIKMDAGKFLKFLNSIDFGKTHRAEWLNYLKTLKKKYNQEKEIKRNKINDLPYTVMQIINKYSKEGDIFCVDVGQNQMFSAQMLKVKKGQKFFTSGGLAPMGYALPAAIGASFAKGKQGRIFSIMGDGGFHIALQSLMLISQYNLPIKVIILNNCSLGMIAQFQDLYFQSRKAATVKETGYWVPEIEQIAKAYNLKYYRLCPKKINDEDCLDEIFGNGENCIVEVLIGEDTKVVPKLEVDMPLEEISPQLNEVELKKNMLIKLVNKGENVS